ncbi:MAG: RNA-binding protein [Burkholderiales bacterium]
MRLWIGNIEPGTDDETLRAFVHKYAKGVTVTKMQRIDGDGSRPAALLSFEGDTFEAVPALALRLDGMYWQGRKLSCSAEMGPRAS